MIGVIVVPGHSPLMHGLDANRSFALLPLGDRPMLQHVIESLAAQKITSIELIVSHAPKEVESLLGNGDRWGCRFRYHLATQPDRPYRSLKIISALKDQPWCLIHAECFPCIDLPSVKASQPVLLYGSVQDDPAADGQQAVAGSSVWRGAAVFPAGSVTDAFASQSIDELRQQLESMAASSEATVLHVSQWLDGSTPAALLETQTALLDRRFEGLMISGVERESNVWISRNVVIHPTVELVPPLYLGPNSRVNRGVRLGPNVVIEGECIVDSDTSIEHSLITAGSYIGQGLELNKALVDHNLLINVRLGTSVEVVESFLLGGLKQVRRSNMLARILEPILAILLIILFLPVSLLSLVVYALLRRLTYTPVRMVQLPARENEVASRTYPLLCLGADAWVVRRVAGWRTFLRQFLPGLFAVAQGKISFVGLPPRTVEEIEKLPSDWPALYLEGSSGLITEAALSLSDPRDETQRYLADAYYTVRRSFLYNLKLFFQYFGRVIFPGGPGLL